MRPFRLALHVVFSALSTFLAVEKASAQRVPTDFDNDGLSDFVLITTGAATLEWSAFLSSNSTIMSLGSLGEPGDEVALGDWSASGTPQLGVVSGSALSRTMNWEIQPVGGTMSSATFGDYNTLALSGGDFNGDGKTDAATVEKYRSRLVWKINTDLISNLNAFQTITWGGVREQAFFVNPDGQHDWIAVIRRTGIRAFNVRMYNPSTGEVRRLKGSGFFGLGNPRPVPLKLAGGGDMLFTHKAAAGVTALTFLSLADGSKTEKLIAGDGDVVVGNFTADDGEEVAVQTETGFTIYNPTTDTTTDVVVPDGIAVDEININQINQSRSGDDGDGGLPPTGGTGPGLDTVCATRSAIAMGELLIKSEISNHIHRGDKRATGYTLVCARLCPKNLRPADFFYSDGAYAGSVGYYGRFSGNGKPRLYGAAGGAPQHFVRQINPQSTANGRNGKLYMQMSRAKTGAETQCKEFNPTGRNGGL